MKKYLFLWVIVGIILTGLILMHMHVPAFVFGMAAGAMGVVFVLAVLVVAGLNMMDLKRLERERGAKRGEPYDMDGCDKGVIVKAKRIDNACGHKAN